MNSITALVLAAGMHGYYCTNNGAHLGYFHLYDKGAEIMTIVAPKDAGNVATFGTPLEPLKSPSVKADPNVKCYALVPLN